MERATLRRPIAMLVDAWRLAKALDAAGISVAPRCADVATPGKTGGPCLRVCIAKDLSISIYPVPDDALENLWTFRQANFHFWPVIRSSSPLCNSDESDRVLDLVKTAPKQKIGEIYKVELGRATYDVGTLCEAEKSEREYHRSKFGNTRTLNPAVRSVVRLRMRLARLSGKALEQALQQAIANADLYPALFALLFGRLDKGNVKATGQIAFDLAEATIYSHGIRSAVEKRLSTS